MDLSEFEDSLVYRVNSRLVRATKQTTCLAPLPPPAQKNQKRKPRVLFCFRSEIELKALSMSSMAPKGRFNAETGLEKDKMVPVCPHGDKVTYFIYQLTLTGNTASARKTKQAVQHLYKQDRSRRNQ